VSILITSANTAAAHQLKNKLNSAAIIWGDYHELPEFMLKAGKMMSLPDPKLSSYTHQMLALCLDRGIDTIYVLDEAEEALLKESEQLFKEYNINLYYKNDQNRNNEI
jgi:hypothetical protein